MVGVGGYHAVSDNLHISCENDECDFLLLQQFHLLLLNLSLVGVIFLYRPYIIGDVKLLGNISQVLMVAYDARDIHVKLARLVSGKQVV